MSDVAVEEIPVLYLRWKVDARSRGGKYIYSSVFGFQGEQWRLEYSFCNDGCHSLDLDKMSVGCQAAFKVSVHVESGPGGRILTELTEKKRFATGSRSVENLWLKSDGVVQRADPQFNRKRELRFWVVLTAKDFAPLPIYLDHCLKPDTRHTNVSVQTPLHASHISSLEDLSADLSELLSDQGSNPDVTFECAGLSIGAHKTVLSARSPVIGSMLSSDMLEGKTGIVRIPDMEPDTFQKFLRYLYTGQLDTDELTFEAALALYEAGDQYSVRGLAKRCSAFLKAHLTVQNACEVLAIADAHSNPEMVDAVVTYILEKDVPLVSDLWSTFSEDHPKLASKVLYHFYKSRK